MEEEEEVEEEEEEAGEERVDRATDPDRARYRADSGGDKTFYSPFSTTTGGADGSGVGVTRHCGPGPCVASPGGRIESTSEVKMSPAPGCCHQTMSTELDSFRHQRASTCHFDLWLEWPHEDRRRSHAWQECPRRMPRTGPLSRETTPTLIRKSPRCKAGTDCCPRGLHFGVVKSRMSRSNHRLGHESVPASPRTRGRIEAAERVQGGKPNRWPIDRSLDLAPSHRTRPN